MIEFILGAPFVLSAVIVIVIAIAFLLEFEKPGWATTWFSLGAALTLWAYKSEVWTFVSTSPLPTLYFILSYVLAGLIWSLIKWKNYISKRTQKFNTEKEKFVEKNGGIGSHWSAWIKHLNSTIYRSLSTPLFYEVDTPEEVVANIIPKANDKKSVIISWISYWPMSLAATLLNNPFRKFFEWIYGLVSGVYDRMSKSENNKMMAGLEKSEQSDKKQLNS